MLFRSLKNRRLDKKQIREIFRKIAPEGRDRFNISDFEKHFEVYPARDRSALFAIRGISGNNPLPLVLLLFFGRRPIWGGGLKLAETFKNEEISRFEIFSLATNPLVSPLSKTRGVCCVRPLM